MQFKISLARSAEFCTVYFRKTQSFFWRFLKLWVECRANIFQLPIWNGMVGARPSHFKNQNMNPASEYYTESNVIFIHKPAKVLTFWKTRSNILTFSIPYHPSSQCTIISKCDKFLKSYISTNIPLIPQYFLSLFYFKNALIPKVLTLCIFLRFLLRGLNFSNPPITPPRSQHTVNVLGLPGIRKNIALWFTITFNMFRINIHYARNRVWNIFPFMENSLRFQIRQHHPKKSARRIRSQHQIFRLCLGLNAFDLTLLATVTCTFSERTTVVKNNIVAGLFTEKQRTRQ